MAHRPRMAVPASPHHIIQRGNNCQAIFFAEDNDRLQQTDFERTPAQQLLAAAPSEACTILGPLVN
jgi:hypothetical protein